MDKDPVHHAPTSPDTQQLAVALTAPPSGLETKQVSQYASPQPQSFAKGGNLPDLPDPPIPHAALTEKILADTLPALTDTPTVPTSSVSPHPTPSNETDADNPFLAAVLEQSYRHLFGPTSQPAAPRRSQVISISGLTSKLVYLNEADLKFVKEAFHFSDQAHLGQYRQSGEPYITHPVAVAEVCAEWKLDAQSIMAALLHDVIEDQGISRQELTERFGHKVAELVDGLTKLDKLEFQSREEAQAESFRKMLLAMARDVRVILVKLADRLHNMRTLQHVPADKRRRIAAETMDIYAPIAHRLGLNTTYRELQDLSFASAMPFRYATLEKAIKAARGNRREVVNKIMEGAQKSLTQAGIHAELNGREKTLYSIYRKMRDKHLSFSQVLDVYGFRVVVENQLDCYTAMGALHSLYKPMPGKFKDYIAIPKINGYQSLHTTLVGPFGTPVEFQIRTRDMHEIAEAGVAAHWLYKNGAAEMNDVQKHAHQWLQSLLDIQSQSGDSQEFLEHVKIDLFPDAVYIFTPKGHIRALPRGATALDFAYAVHSDLGNQCVAVKLNNELMPLRTELTNGDIVEVITAPYSKPNPAWLSFVRTGKARAAIRHYLKTIRYGESVQLGERLLEQASRALGIDLAHLPSAIWERLLLWTGHKEKESIFAELALGRRVAVVTAKRIQLLIQQNSEGYEFSQPTPENSSTELSAVMINGSEGTSVQFASCCRPIPGDAITGYLGKGEGLQIHVHDCPVARRIRQKDPERWIDVIWAERTHHTFDAGVRMLIHNDKGVLARIAADITAADANIAHVAMEDKMGSETTDLHLVLQVQDRLHLANVLRTVRRNPHIVRVTRDRQEN